MFVPVPVVVASGFVFLLMAGLLFRASLRRDASPGAQPPASPWEDRPAGSPVPMSAETEAQVRALIAAGRTIEAIKFVREATRLGLKESKEMVDRLG